jgi:rhodanese-related sulfurtransferase
MRTGPTGHRKLSVFLEQVMSVTLFSRTRRALLLLAASIVLPTTSVLAGSIPAELTAPEAQALASKGELKLIDVRTPEEWRDTGVAPGAARINMYHAGGSEGFLKDVLESVNGDKSAPIAVICRSGNRSTRVQSFLVSQGFTNVSNVREGMGGGGSGPGWVQRGLPVDACKRC